MIAILNWFETLNQSLESEELTEYWDCLWPPLSYGEYRQFNYIKDGYNHHASIYRETDGRYERPVHYRMDKVK